MELTITNNREIKPYKVAVKQYESGTTSLVFTRTGYMYDQVDLRNYTPYAVTSINGSVDMTELEMEVVNGNLVITWVIQEQSLRQAGTITYQIVFKQDPLEYGENTGVFYTYEAIIQNSASIDSDRPIVANYPTILKQWLDLINDMAGTISAGIVYMEVNNPTPVESRLAGRLYYQIENADTYEGHFEDNLGNVIGQPRGQVVVNPNINMMISQGEYLCSGTITNAPITCDFCVVRVTDTPTTDRVLQEVYVVASDNTVRVFSRAITGYDTFGAWREQVTNVQLDEKLDKTLDRANSIVVTGSSGQVTTSTGVTTAELNTLDGINREVTIQQQLNDKLNKKLAHTNGVLITDANGNIVTHSTVGNTELGYLDGATSNIQIQLNNKAELDDFNVHVASNNATIDTINQTLETIDISTDIIEQSFITHANNATIHVSATDRDKWNNSQTAFPVGTLITSICSNVQGWLLCDGSTYNTADYPNLATALGATGSTFTVPDFRGRTMWGASTSQPLGSVIQAGLPNISGTVLGANLPIVDGSYMNDRPDVADGAFYHDQNDDTGQIMDGGGHISETRALKMDASRSSSIYGGSNTVQPPAIAVNIFIKY